MPITLQGSLDRILMNDGSYLLGQVGGNGSSWTSFSRFLVQAGTTGVFGDTYVYFPVSFPNQCCRVIVSEQNASGWGTEGMTIYGINGSTTGYFIVRGALKQNGGAMFSPATGISCNWVAIGY